VGWLSEQVIEEIKNRNPLLDLVSCYVTLKKSGKSYQGLCPFHSERTPSFSVSPEKGLWYCFGCGTGGNIFDFVKKIENVSFPEAARILAEKAGVEVQEETVFSEDYKNRKDIFSINELAADFYHWLLFKDAGKNALFYLNSRKVSRDIILKFKLGFAPASKDSFLKLLKKRQFPSELGLKAALIRGGADGNYRDYFCNRVIFPIFDLQDRVIAFGGRILDDGTPKYLNTSETDVFNKGKILYGLNLARKRSDRSSPLILTEGYMDLISVVQAGLDGVVASLGTSLTKDQANLLAKFTSEVIIAYDADTAGIAATGRGLGLLESAGLSVKVLMLPEGKDPDSLIKEKGSGVFQNLLKERVDYFPYLLTWLEKKYDISTREGKEGFFKGIEPFMTTLEEQLRRDEYFKILESKNLGISQQELRSRFRIYREKKKLLVPVSTGKSVADTERLLIRLMLQDEEIVEKVFRRIKPEEFTDSICNKIADISYKILINKKVFSVDEIIKNIKDEHVCKVLAEMLLIEDDYPKNDESIFGLIHTLKEEKLRRKMKELKFTIDQSKNAPCSEILKEYYELSRYFSGNTRKGGKSLRA